MTPMLLKRKRSIDSSLTSPDVSSSIVQKANFPSSTFVTSRPLLNSRTQKRYRDNRPSEEMIHTQTLHKLYDAQRGQQSFSHVQHGDVQAQKHEHHAPQVSTQPRKQKSLHSFWQLPSTARSTGPEVETNMNDEGDRCEDCDALLQNNTAETDGDYAMGDASMELEAQAHLGGGVCEECGRKVCGLCSLVPKQRRVCLECVGRGWV